MAVGSVGVGTAFAHSVEQGLTTLVLVVLTVAAVVALVQVVVRRR